MKNVFGIILACSVLYGCTFHSSQLDFIVDFLNKKDSQIKANESQKNWEVSWKNNSVDLYAVNFNNHIIFTDGETNIIYKDQKIILANGKLFNEDMIQVRENMSIFEFVINDIQISTAICENWITKDLDEQELVLSQHCKSSSKTDNNTINYTNKIYMNSNQQISSLIYKVHPNLDSLKLSLK